MTTKDSTLVRLPKDLLARLDGRRGQLSRAAFIGLLLDREAGRTKAEGTNAGHPTLPLRRTEVTPRFKK